jgi:peptidoglycan/LPS O-acetylase OafA/YrhL
VSAAPSPAVAPPPGNPRFPLFDSLRGMAVLAVVVFHVFLVSGALGWHVLGRGAAELGNLGPILFFAISGFLLYRPWVAARAGRAPAPAADRYARRRALRILPAYWLALTVLAVFPGVAGAFGADWWRYYLFLQLYSSETVNQGIPVAWTLCVEVAFYVALPFWAVALRRAGRRTELAALALVVLAGAAVQVAGARHAVSLVVAESALGQSTWLALGMALAVVSAYAPSARLPRPALCWVGAAVAFAGAAALRPSAGGPLGILAALAQRQPVGRTAAEIALTAAGISLLMAPAIFSSERGLPQRTLTFPPLAWLGLVSYGVYLWHLTLAELLALDSAPGQFSARGLGLAGTLGWTRTPVLLALTLALSCAVAAASYYVVELPFLRRKETP